MDDKFTRRRAIELLAISAFLAPSCRSSKNAMNDKTCKLSIRVIAVEFIQKFSGDAIVACLKPKFVVCVLLKGMKGEFVDPESSVRIPVQNVAFFAIDSVVRLFKGDDVVGKDYTLIVNEEAGAGPRRYYLQTE